MVSAQRREESQVGDADVLGFIHHGKIEGPVFASGKYTPVASHTINTEDSREHIKPAYFNTGCCCYNDGDITGIEIAEGYIRLIKWFMENGISRRAVLEEKLLAELVIDLELAEPGKWE